MGKLKKQTIINIGVISFIIIELILTILIQLIGGKVLSFLSIVLACLFSIVFISKSKDYILTQIALFTTVCADIFLVVLDPMIQLPAMIFFSITQLCYFIRILINQTNVKIRTIHVIVRCVIVLIAIIATCLTLKENTDALSIISLFYYANLLVNVVFSFINYKNIVLSAGLICFACCDFFIGLDVLSSSYLPIHKGSILYYLNNIDFNIAWLFYVPSQTLLSLSLYNNKK